MAQTVKQQLQTVKTQHKNDIDSLRKQVSDSKKEAQRYQTLVSSQRSQWLENYLKLECIAGDFGPIPNRK